MHINKKVVFKICVGLALLLFSVWIWVDSYRTYSENRDDILIQIEEYIAVLTLPIKTAKLTAQEPVTAIPVPVFGVPKRDIADTWGEPRAGGRMHEGVDIFAERGTPVMAATRGYVVRVGESDLGGIHVYTAGPGGVRYYYAHLDSIAEGIAVGTPVHTDTILGFVGDTGNASGTPPHLHFGIYQRGAQDPFPQLTDRD